MGKEREWKFCKFEYEGFPLLLRLPVGLNYNELSRLYTLLISVEHHLSKVTGNGLPNKEYNETLIDFDEYVINSLELRNEGICVLVETFGGNRTYYMYAKDSTEIDKIEEDLKTKYPEHKVELEMKTDKDWSFIKRYANEWRF